MPMSAAEKEGIFEIIFVVVNAVINSVSRGKEEPCDIGENDIMKAFDSLWAK